MTGGGGRLIETAVPPALVLAILTVALHLATSAGYGWFRDEMYYVACARHLDWGYVDHPPLTPLLLRGLLAVAGPSLPAMRALAAVAAGLTVLVAARLARVLGGGRRAEVAAAIPVMVAPISVGVFGIFTPNAIDVLLWSLALLVLTRILAGGDPRLWLLFGAIAGVGLQNKHTFAILPFATAAGLVATRARRWLASPWPWAGAALAGALVLPHLLWQSLHGWPTLEFVANARADKIAGRSVLAFLAEQAMVTNPAALPLWTAGLVWLLAAEAARPWRALGAGAVAAIALTAASGGKAYYVTPIYTVLFAAGGVWLERAATRRRWLLPTALAAVAGTGVLAAPLAKPLLSEEATVRWMRATALAPDTGSGERHAFGELPQIFADMHGWPELAAAVARVHAALPAEERSRACIFASNYGEAAAIDLFGPALGLPPAISGHNAYHHWGPGACDARTVIVLGASRESLEALFAQVEAAARTDCRWCMPSEARLTVWLARDPRVPPAALWAAAKRFV